MMPAFLISTGLGMVGGSMMLLNPQAGIGIMAAGAGLAIAVVRILKALEPTSSQPLGQAVPPEE